MAAEKPVRACICYPHSFARLKAMAQEKGWSSPEEITAAVGCGSGCGLCRPYLARMLATGETAFEVLPPESEEDPSRTQAANQKLKQR